MKRILVTGAAGFVGRHALNALAADAAPTDRIVGIGRGLPTLLPAGVLFEQVDLSDEKALSTCIAAFHPTDVLHLAAMASVQQSLAASTETWRSNVVGLLNLAEILLRCAEKVNLFFVSTAEVYGRAFLTGKAVSEGAEPNPIGTYGRSKWFGEQILNDVLIRSNVRLVIFRPFNHIGPGQDERFVVPSFAGQIARIEAGLAPPVLEVGNLEAQRDFLAVADVVRAYTRVISRAVEIPGGTVFNIASGQPRTIGSVLDDLRRNATRSFEVRIKTERMRPSEIPVAFGDASKIKAAVSWEPIEDWGATLANVLAYAREIVYRSKFLS